MRSFLHSAIAIAGLAMPLGAQHHPFTVPAIPSETYTLPNGLTVILSEDHSAPVVAVDVWYHVGSKNELPGRTGFAHLFEHMMFQGSQHVPYGIHFKTIENAGGDANGSTENDRTNYYETLPNNQLATALWLESDRMGFLLPALDQAKLDAQREVVKNERRQRLDNVPYGSEGEVLSAAMFPASNPYSWPVIGSMADLSAASLDDVTRFFRTYYAPNNATLAVVGDFRPAAAKALITTYFASIPAGGPVTRPAVPPVRLAAEQRLVLEDSKAEVPQLEIAWPTVGRHSSDDVALRVLGDILTQDRTSRLTKLLKFDRQLVSDVGAGQEQHEDAGRFVISVTPRPNASLTEIEGLIDSTLTALTTQPPTQQEVDRIKNHVRVDMTLALQAGVLERAEYLLDGQTFHGDPLYYKKDVDAQLAVTPDDVARVARQYLTAGRIVLSMVPAGKLDAIAKPSLPYTNVTPKPEVQASASTSSAPTGR
jgi:zinc protease